MMRAMSNWTVSSAVVFFLIGGVPAFAQDSASASNATAEAVRPLDSHSPGR
jgi:hypothetical protein